MNSSNQLVSFNKTNNPINGNNKQEYNPLTGVSFKPSHASDVEIVGVKLGSNSNQENNYSIENHSNLNSNSQIKKKASFQSKL